VSSLGRQAHHRDRAPHQPRRPTEPRPRKDRRTRYRLTIKPPDRRRSSTTIRTSSRGMCTSVSSSLRLAARRRSSARWMYADPPDDQPPGPLPQLLGATYNTSTDRRAALPHWLLSTTTRADATAGSPTCPPHPRSQPPRAQHLAPRAAAAQFDESRGRGSTGGRPGRPSRSTRRAPSHSSTRPRQGL
jgi:hypothetical protein